MRQTKVRVRVRVGVRASRVRVRVSFLVVFCSTRPKSSDDEVVRYRKVYRRNRLFTQWQTCSHPVITDRRVVTPVFLRLLLEAAVMLDQRLAD